MQAFIIIIKFNIKFTHRATLIKQLQTFCITTLMILKIHHMNTQCDEESILNFIQRRSICWKTFKNLW